ncbi:putative FMNH2-dependent monooxygenase [Gordonia effusa NBRC 100432]|uniref:Putative FMNH2-dependent monooxygenase n=1 Tax=Gordonia effusa NBRC 100432 TaxID=1077974 RepID=H0R5F2_9ACTN|nr:LLM class flavin-dependent oxidoreductase [Gordonia effusa]GAB20303.1 putative FMNH2-dependent monooxygenase [Gordonia effusa NBRC 100432]
MARQLHLNAFLMGVGHHEAAWRHPRTDEHAVLDVNHFVRLGQIAERGKLDSVFFADTLAIGPNPRRNVAAIFEPLTLLAAIAGGTSRVGLIATASTGYNHPFTLARAFASLEHISGGRTGWNIVTSAGKEEAANFGYDSIPDHAGRYRRAQEFVDVANRLWDSWGDDSVVLDVERAIFADADQISTVDHVGEHFSVRGPLNSPRSPQGRPVLVQAGSSEPGKDLAARHAEVVFTAQRTIVEGREFYDDLKGRLAGFGRNIDDLQILPGIVPFIGATHAEAVALEQEFTELISPDYALRQLSHVFNVDLTDLSLDAPLPDLPPESEIEGQKSRSTLVRQLAAHDNLTTRELLGKLGGGRGHRTIAGTAEEIADDLIAWVDAGAADGFNVMPPYLPGGLEDFVDQVVPILQERGRFRTDYSASTLRGHYGIKLPAHHAEAVPATA